MLMSRSISKLITLWTQPKRQIMATIQMWLKFFMIGTMTRYVRYNIIVYILLLLSAYSYLFQDKDILTYRDISFTSKFTSTKSPIHHTTFMTALDDSLQCFMNTKQFFCEIHFHEKMFFMKLISRKKNLFLTCVSYYHRPLSHIF